MSTSGCCGRGGDGDGTRRSKSNSGPANKTLVRASGMMIDDMLTCRPSSVGRRCVWVGYACNASGVQVNKHTMALMTSRHATV